MTNRDKDLEELAALVVENRNAFDRAKRLLSAMKQRSQGEPEVNSHPSEQGQANPIAKTSDESTVPDTDGHSGSDGSSRWLDLEQLARVELGGNELPAEFATCALSHKAGTMWRPKEPGQQTIRLVFAVPQRVAKVRLVFIEQELERTQEFVLRWLPRGTTVYQEILRQQYVFSPAGSTTEVEEYQVDLRNLRVIELCIVPDISKRPVFASLAHWGLA